MSKTKGNYGPFLIILAGGIADYEPGVSENFRSVFEKADTLMYKEKKLLKSMGAATRT